MTFFTKVAGGQSGRRRQAMKLMRHFMQRSRDLLDEGLEPLGVTTAQLQVLHQVALAGERPRESAAQGGSMSGAGIARMCGVTPQTAQALLVRSEREGLLRRGGDPANERLVLWSLTPAGRRLLDRSQVVVEQLMARAWKGLPAADVREVTRVLERCMENLREE